MINRVMKGLLGFFSVFIILGIIASVFDNEKQKTNTEQKKEHKNTNLVAKINYTIIKKSDYSFPRRKRIRWIIYSKEADTGEKRRNLFLQASYELQKSSGADQVNIFIEPLPYIYASGKGDSLAIGTYTPDGLGNSGDSKSNVWELELSQQQLTNKELSILNLWYKHRDNFRSQNGLVNEKALKTRIAETLNIPISDVSKKWISREKISL